MANIDMIDQNLVTAWHEAGHVMCAYEFASEYVTIRSLTIVPGPGYMGIIHCQDGRDLTLRPSEWAVVDDPRFNSDPIRTKINHKIRALMRVRMGGPIAHAFAYDQFHPATGVLNTVASLIDDAENIVGFDDALPGYIEEDWGITRDFLFANLEILRDISEELFKRKSINDQQWPDFERFVLSKMRR